MKSSASLYIAAGFAAFSGIAYELLLASYATFLLGASIVQYSLVISLMMASMGLGSLVSDRFSKRPLKALLTIESCLACFAVFALPTLYWVYSQNISPHLPLLLFVILMGGGLGMEIPLINTLSDNPKGLPKLLFWDYLGGFIGGLLFPLVLVPRMGFFQIAGLLSLANSVTGLILVISHRRRLGQARYFWFGLVVASLILSIGYLSVAKGLRLEMETTLFGIKHP